MHRPSTARRLSRSCDGPHRRPPSPSRRPRARRRRGHDRQRGIRRQHDDPGATATAPASTSAVVMTTVSGCPTNNSRSAIVGSLHTATAPAVRPPRTARYASRVCTSSSIVGTTTRTRPGPAGQPPPRLRGSCRPHKPQSAWSGDRARSRQRRLDSLALVRPQLLFRHAILDAKSTYTAGTAPQARQPLPGAEASVGTWRSRGRAQRGRRHSRAGTRTATQATAVTWSKRSGSTVTPCSIW